MNPTPLTVTPKEGRGTDINYVDADVVNGNTFANDGWTGLMCKNDTNAEVTLQVHVSAKFDEFLDVVPLTELLQPGAEYFFGLIPVRYNQPDGTALVTASSICKIAAFQIAPAQ